MTGAYDESNGMRMADCGVLPDVTACDRTGGERPLRHPTNLTEMSFPATDSVYADLLSALNDELEECVRLNNLFEEVVKDMSGAPAKVLFEAMRAYHQQMIAVRVKHYTRIQIERRTAREFPLLQEPGLCDVDGVVPRQAAEGIATLRRKIDQLSCPGIEEVAT